MKTAAIRALRRRLAEAEPLVGIWVTLEAPSITEMAVALGIDWIVIDAEHGHLDWNDIVAHVRAAVRSNTVVLVRVSELNCSAIKRTLDLGADGVVIPWIETAEQLRQAVAFSRYPPLGVRGIGAERATAWGQCFAEHAGEADDHVLVVPMIETVRGGENLGALLEVEGTEIFFLGPADYSASAGYPGQWEGPGVAQMLLEFNDAIRLSGKHCGIVTVSADDYEKRRDKGFRMLGLGTDAGLLLRSLKDSLTTCGRSCTMAPDLVASPR